MPELVYKLNNPLASAIGYAQLLLPKMINPELKENVAKIIEETQQASQIIKDLVNFVRERRPRKKVVSLNDLIEASLKIKTPELNFKNITLIKELSPSLPFTQVDPKQIKQVLFHLIKNAEEAISEFHGFGQIWVKTRALEGQIEIVISDNGPGIAKENVSKIFDPLFTTKQKGIGLGLTIAYAMLTEHGGTMRVESEWGKGTTFMITLPVVEVESEKVKEKRKGVEEDLKGMKGLVIDDDPNILYLTSKYLESEECEIITAPTVKTALNIIESKNIDFVLCDMRMPEMGGIEFYKTIKEKKPSLKDRIIFSTGDVMNDLTRAFFELVTNPHLEKPFHFDELKEVIASMKPQHAFDHFHFGKETPTVSPSNKRKQGERLNFEKSANFTPHLLG